MPRRGPVLLVSNHLTNYDALAIGIFFKRQMNFMAKEELFKVPFVGWIITKLNTFPISRERFDRTALRRSEELLGYGRVVCIFPEGHRSKDGRLQEAKGGIALLARRTQAPILPVAITGTDQYLPHNLKKWRPWRRPLVTMTVGEPFYLPKPEGRANYDELGSLVMERVAALLPAERQKNSAETIDESP